MGFFLHFSSPEQSSGMAIILPPAWALVSVLAKCKVFYVVGKALKGKLSYLCDRSCYLPCS